MNLKELLESRKRELEPNISDDWVWVKTDTGAWEGPFTDWSKSHRQKYFESVSNFDTVVTAGGNCGAYVRAYGNRFKNVYAFEPEFLNFYCMVLNNPQEHIHKFQAALGEKPGLCSVKNTNKANVGMATVETKEDSQIIMMTIDGLCLKKCDLIQLDVEGYEIYALKGAKETIEKFSPTIICERNSDEVNKFLARLGYVQTGRSVADFIYTKK